MPLDEVPETTELQEMTERKENVATVSEEEYQIDSSSNIGGGGLNRPLSMWHPDYLVLPNRHDEARRQYYVDVLSREP